MYKDKDKQREAVKAATKRYRAKKGDSALSGSKVVSQNAPESSVVDEVSDTLPVIPSKVIPCDTPNVIPKRGKDIKAFTDLPNTETVPPVEQVRYKLPSVKVSAKPQSHSPMMVGYVPPKN